MYVSVYVCVYVKCVCACVWRCHGGQKRLSELLELRLLAPVSNLRWVLGTELRFSTLWVLEVKVRSPSSGSKHFYEPRHLTNLTLLYRLKDFCKGRNQGWGRARGRRNKGKGEKHANREGITQSS